LDAVNWYDWISPSNPYAAIVLGLIIVLTVIVFVWIEERDLKTVLYVFLAGAAVVLAGVFLFSSLGFMDRERGE
jgi:type IV secretory pathway VirB3-like protein